MEHRIIRSSLCWFAVVLIVSLTTACSDGNDKPADNGDNTTVEAPPVIPHTVVNTFPHDTTSFTQGLSIYKGQLYESTGSPDHLNTNGSWVGPVDLATGKNQPKAKLDSPQFGEGSTILNDKVYYITWQSKKGYVYDLKTFKKIKEFTYTTEGWGLTNDGKHIILSDGTNNLYFYEPDSMKVVTVTSVSDNNGPVPNINELEFINGYIYANQWLTPYILKIDPASGKVIGRLDMSELVKAARAKYPSADELNGIAFDSASGKLYVTGKKWPELFEIKIQ